eukprot:204096-Chlamydomonas_euryale.AAC.1
MAPCNPPPHPDVLHPSSSHNAAPSPPGLLHTNVSTCADAHRRPGLGVAGPGIAAAVRRPCSTGQRGGSSAERELCGRQRGGTGGGRRGASAAAAAERWQHRRAGVGGVEGCLNE